MKAMDIFVIKSKEFWKTESIARRFPYIFIVISVIGSLIKLTDLVPETYFSNSRNFLNVYFVKVSWGWTISLLLPFITLSCPYKDWALVKRLVLQVVSTFLWYTCTSTFSYIEELTSHCYESPDMQVMHGEFISKESCRKAGFLWLGFDISGHSFILTFSALVIVEEIKRYNRDSKSRSYRTTTDVLYVALNAIVALWIWMFGCTSVYFHELSHKLAGTICAMVMWCFLIQLSQSI